MVDEQKIIEALSPIERTVLPHLAKESAEVNEICKKADVDKTTVLRALEFLKKKKLAETKETTKKIVIAGIN